MIEHGDSPTQNDPNDHLGNGPTRPPKLTLESKHAKTAQENQKHTDSVGHHDQSTFFMLFLAVQHRVQRRASECREQHTDTGEVNELVDIVCVHIMSLPEKLHVYAHVRYAGIS